MKIMRPAVSRDRVFLMSFFLLLSLIPGGVVSAGSVDLPDKNHSECVYCHRMPGSAITETNLFPEGIDPSSVCLDCHHYSDNHHPVNFSPRTPFRNAGDFPLFEGQVRCLTCHRVHGTRGTIAKSKLLRGGPYDQRTEICFSCHDRDLNTRINPHLMLDDKGAIRNINGEPVCLICHASMPDQTVTPVKVTFKADVAFLCWRCHPPMMDAGFFKGHFLVRPKKSTLEYMVRFQAEKGIILPLQPRDRVTCSTCHNPHQAGVIAFGPAMAGADAPHRLRMPREGVCSGCHNI